MLQSSPDTDAELLVRLKTGDAMAFTALYDRYKQPLFAFCLRMLHDQARAEDVVHDTFLKVFRESHTLLNLESFRSWLFRIARNETLMLIRRNRESEPLDTDGIWEEETPLSVLEKAEERVIVQTLLNTLKKEYREVLHLREYQQLSYAEIARITGTTESSVKSRIFKARQALAQKLNPWFQERTRQ